MKPALAAVVAKVRLSGDWPDVKDFGFMLIKAGADAEEVVSIASDYKRALFSGKWPPEYGTLQDLRDAAAEGEPLPPSTDNVLDVLRAFRLPEP